MNESRGQQRHPSDHRRGIRLWMGLLFLTLFLVVATARVYLANLPLPRVMAEFEPDNIRDNNRGLDPISAMGGGRTDAQFIATKKIITKRSLVKHVASENGTVNFTAKDTKLKREERKESLRE